MPSVTSLLALFCVLVTVNYVSAQQVGDQRVHLFFEYLRPYWRRHRARIRPYVFVRPAPLWRVARSTEEPDEAETNCFYFNPHSRLACFRNMDMMDCKAEKIFSNSMLLNFLEFEMGEIKNTTTGHSRFNLYPKVEKTSKTTAQALKKPGQNKVVSIHPSELAASDDGIRLSDSDCWKLMKQFIADGQYKKEIKVERSTPTGKKIEQRNVIGKLFVSPF